VYADVTSEYRKNHNTKAVNKAFENVLLSSDIWEQQ
jgi:hypothetical protein